MSSFNLQNLSVKVMPPATYAQPIDGRRYTLTHSDITGELFLSIGNDFDVAAIDPILRDEVIAEWKRDGKGLLYLAGEVHVDSENNDKAASMIRFTIFRTEMDTALKGIIVGDQSFFTTYPVLVDATIYIAFNSIYPEYNQVFYFGTPRQYLQHIYA